MDNTLSIVRVLLITTISFLVAMAWTPRLDRFLHKYKLGKKVSRKAAPVFSKLHKKKEGTPTMGGLLVWLTVAGLAALFWFVFRWFNGSFFKNLNFLTRPQTLLPLGAMICGAIIGLFDDIINIKEIGPFRGLRMWHRLLLYTAVAVGGAWWFYFKLDWDVINIPFLGNFFIGWAYIPLFIFIIVATAFSVNETDGLDGLAGGVLLIAFGAFGAIAFSQGKVELAMLCAAISGALVAFLWFNVYPARFFMGDTGAMSLGVTLGIIAMLTNSALLLPLIGFILVLESGSVIIQIASRKLRGVKIFLSAPLHHHFEARGWPESRVTMRFWIIAGVMATLGLIIRLIG